MDRVAQLAKEADHFIRWERRAAELARQSTREVLADYARELGFQENEISAAIDTALGGR